MKPHHFNDAAQKTLALYANDMKLQPRSLPQMLVALNYELNQTIQIALIGKRGSDQQRAFIQAAHRDFNPNKIIIVLDETSDPKLFEHYIPYLKNKSSNGDQTTAYICVNYACKLPTSDLQTFKELLRK